MNSKKNPPKIKVLQIFNRYVHTVFSVLVMFLFISMFWESARAQTCDYCSELNCEDYLICEDWESDDPGDFPHTKNSYFHDAHAGNYGRPEDNRITNEIAHSGLRCLKLQKSTSSKGGGDVEFSFPNQDEIYVRWYYYFPEGWCEGFDNCRSGHLVFVNTAYHGYLRIDNFNNYALGMDLPNVETGIWIDEGTNIWRTDCDPPSDVWDQVRSVRFDGDWGIKRNSIAEIAGTNEWYHDYANDRLYIYSISDPDKAFTNPGIWVADNARRGFNLGSTYGCPRNHRISIGGFEAENEDYCWTCENMYGPGKYTSGNSTKPLYHKDEDIDNTYWSLFDNEGKWICFEFYANNNNHTTKFWIDGELWMESNPGMFIWGGEGSEVFNNGFNKIIFSNYRHDSSFSNTLYIDDVVVSTNYIGPMDDISNVTPQICSNSDNFILQQNYPNPFNPSTTIDYSVTKPCYVQILIYNQLGQEVCTLVNKQMSVGEHSVTLNGIDAKGNKLAGGVYFYRLTAGKQVDTRRMLYLR